MIIVESGVIFLPKKDAKRKVLKNTITSSRKAKPNPFQKWAFLGLKKVKISFSISRGSVSLYRKSINQ